jgi:tight adherence protein C
MSLTQYLSYALIALAVFTVYIAGVGLFRRDRNQLRAKEIESQAQLPEGETLLSTLLEKFLTTLGINVREYDATSVQLAKAGISGRANVVYFTFFKRIIQPFLLVIGLVILVKLLLIDHAPVKEHLALVLTALLLAVIGALGGKLYLDNLNEKRKKILVKTFPEALDLMLICVESGLGIDAALGRVCKEIKFSHPVIASEFERTRFEMTVMNDRVQALQNLATRTETFAIRVFVNSLTQAERFGTSLVETLRTIAEEQRSERMLRAEAKAARLPALITIPLIFFILPALFMVILGPVFIKISAQGGLFGGH